MAKSRPATRTAAVRAKSSRSSRSTRSSRSLNDKKALSLTRRACIALALPPDFKPQTQMAAILKEVGIHDPWPYLRHAECEEARTLVGLYVGLADKERDSVTLDTYIAAGKVDFHKVFGAISEQVSRIESAKAAMLVSRAAPRMARMAAHWGEGYDGHADRKMLLQSSGVAPIPKTSVTNVSFRDSVIDQRKQVAIGQMTVRVPTLEEVVKDVDATVYEGADPRDASPEKTIPAVIPAVAVTE